MEYSSQWRLRDVKAMVSEKRGEYLNKFATKVEIMPRERRQIGQSETEGADS